MDWIAAVLTFIGTILVGRKIPAGWIFTAVACILWSYIGLTSNLYGMAVINAVLAAIMVFNGFKWRDND